MDNRFLLSMPVSLQSAATNLTWPTSRCNLLALIAQASKRDSTTGRPRSAGFCIRWTFISFNRKDAPHRSTEELQLKAAQQIQARENHWHAVCRDCPIPRVVHECRRVRTAGGRDSDCDMCIVSL